MGDMSRVLLGMAVRAQHLEIAEVVVLPIPVSVVNSQDLQKPVVSTSLTPSEHATADHRLPRRREGCLPCRSVALADAGSAAIDALRRLRCSKRFRAVPAGKFGLPLSDEALVVASPGAVLCNLFSYSDHSKRGGADTTRNVRRIISRVPPVSAPPRAEFGRLRSIPLNSVSSAALGACYFNQEAPPCR